MNYAGIGLPAISLVKRERERERNRREEEGKKESMRESGGETDEAKESEK